jgi:hypothetical protein
LFRSGTEAQFDDLQVTTANIVDGNPGAVHFPPIWKNNCYLGLSRLNISARAKQMPLDALAT